MSRAEQLAEIIRQHTTDAQWTPEGLAAVIDAELPDEEPPRVVRKLSPEELARFQRSWNLLMSGMVEEL